jgi:hypothetical protein
MVSNGWGSKEVTRNEFQQQWLDYSGRMWMLFDDGEYGKYLDMQYMIEELAGKTWDRYSPILVRTKEKA